MLKLDDSTQVGGREKFEVEEVLKRSYSLLVYRTMHFINWRPSFVPSNLRENYRSREAN